MRRSTWALCALVALAALAACDDPKAKETAVTRPPPPDPAELAKLRADILALVPPFAGHPEYAVDDPDLVDRCLRDRLPTASGRADFVRDAAVCVENALAEPDGLARIAKRVAARYANPTITSDGDRVTIDAGVVAGRLHVHRGVIEVFDTDLVDAGEWATPEVVRFLKLAMARYPGARTYVARVEIPRYGATPDWEYSYDRGEDRIRVRTKNRPDSVYVSETLGGDPGRAGSLQIVRLRRENVEQPPPWR